MAAHMRWSCGPNVMPGAHTSFSTVTSGDTWRATISARVGGRASAMARGIGDRPLEDVTDGQARFRIGRRRSARHHEVVDVEHRILLSLRSRARARFSAERSIIGIGMSGSCPLAAAVRSSEKPLQSKELVTSLSVSLTGVSFQPHVYPKLARSLPTLHSTQPVGCDARHGVAHPVLPDETVTQRLTVQCELERVADCCSGRASGTASSIPEPAMAT